MSTALSILGFSIVMLMCWIAAGEGTFWQGFVTAGWIAGVAQDIQKAIRERRGHK